MQSLLQWLSALGLPQYAEVFSQNGIDLDSLALLSERELESLGVLLGHRKKILRAVEARDPTKTSIVVATPDPAQFAPAHIADTIRLSRATLEGERKHVTVLFADLKGSMELLADRDPEQSRDIIDPILRLMIDAVHRYEGTVNQVMGDGIMALFGAPFAVEDHAVRACYAALVMQSALRDHALTLRRVHGVNIQTRVGINSGEVVVGAIGSDLRMEYTAVGQTTHLAARMEQLATPGSILITVHTYSQVEGFFRVKSLGPVPVKGMTDLVDVYELTGSGAAKNRLQAASLRGLTRFVGRGDEIARIFAILDRAKAGHGEILALVGEAGVGKSRLVWEVLHSSRLQGWLTVISSSAASGKAATYGPIVDLLRRYCGIEDRDNSRAVREKLVDKLFDLDRRLEGLLAPFLTLLDIVPDDPDWDRLDPPQKRARILNACKTLLLREAMVQPTLVIIEDLHWLDSETQSLLDSLAESISHARMLLLVNYRPEFQHGWHSKSNYTQIRIDPLPLPNSEELLTALMGEDASLVPLRQALIERTASNPLFLEECVRELVETGAISGTRGAYRLDGSASAFKVPVSVRAVLAARIDRLTVEDKQLLQAAAVLGKDIVFEHLRLITELPDSEIRQRLAVLQSAEFLFETRLFPNLEYTFKHALTHEVAYTGMLQHRRRELHVRALAAIEYLHTNRLEEQWEHLARHAHAGEVWEKLMFYARKCGARAAERSASQQALHWSELALAALDHLPESATTLQQGVDINVDMRNALEALGQYDRILPCLERAEQLAVRAQDLRRLAWVLGHRADSLSVSGQEDLAADIARRALGLLDQEEHIPARLVANQALGLCLFRRGRYREGIQAYDNALACVSGWENSSQLSKGIPPAIYSHFNLSWPNVELGQTERAMRHASEALRLGVAMRHMHGRIVGHHGMLSCLVTCGEFLKAIQHGEAELALIEESGIRLWFPWMSHQLGTSYIMTGEPDRGIALIQAGIDALDGMGVSLFRAWLLSSLAEAQLALDDLTAARRWASEALQQAEQHREYAIRVRAMRVNAVIASREGRNADADHSFREALKAAAELELRVQGAHCKLSLGEHYLRTHNAAAADRELQHAAALFREYGMPYWQKRAEAITL